MLSLFLTDNMPTCKTFGHFIEKESPRFLENARIDAPTSFPLPDNVDDSIIDENFRYLSKRDRLVRQHPDTQMIVVEFNRWSAQ